jgi:Tol biopolymer transport system component
MSIKRRAPGSWFLLLLTIAGCVGASTRGSASSGRIAAVVDTVDMSASPHIMGASTIYIFPLDAKEHPLIQEDRERWIMQWSGWVCPRWSPDGSRLAVVERDMMDIGTGPYGYGGNLYVVDADGSHLTVLTQTNSCAAWSPDGTRLVFFQEGSLYTVDIGSRQATALLEVPPESWEQMWSLDWSPDGTRIIYDTGDAIWEVGSDGTGPVPLIGPCKNCGLYYPRYSPNGEQIVLEAYRVWEDKPDGIYAISRDGSQARWLHPGRLPCWSPDGSQIAFLAEDGIKAMNADGSEAKTIFSEDPWSYGQFDWGP